MRPLPAPGLAAMVLCAFGCAHGLKIERVDADTYRLTCNVSLDQCLQEAAANACDNGPYYVARAINEINLQGRQDVPKPTASSEAVIQCGPSRGWGDQAKTLMSGATGAAGHGQPSARDSVPPPAPKSICAPGATQACVGPGGCQGGQACLPDGSGFAPCDCGGTPASPPAPPSAPTTPPAPRRPPS